MEIEDSYRILEWNGYFHRGYKYGKPLLTPIRARATQYGIKTAIQLVEWWAREHQVHGIAIACKQPVKEHWGIYDY